MYCPVSLYKLYELSANPHALSHLSRIILKPLHLSQTAVYGGRVYKYYILSLSLSTQSQSSRLREIVLFFTFQ